MHRHVRCLATAAALALLPGATLLAQGGTPAAVTLPFTFSGTILGNYQYHTENSASSNPNGSFNKFDLERAYLTFAGPAGDRTSFRVTSDVFQQTNAANAAYYAGWVVRLKYAYLQYDYLKSADWNAFARVGIVHTVLIDHEENFWPRWISQTAVERAGLFSSADGGIATQLSMPNKMGAVYATITNGPGYASRETDHFKDYAARLTLTPLANSDAGIFKNLTISPWAYLGATASKFVAGGAGQVGPVGDGLKRDRYGVFAAIKDPAITVGGDFASMTQTFEGGANTLANPRTAIDSTGNLLSGFVVTKPTMWFGEKSSPFGVVARYDVVKPTGNAKYHVFIGGLTWDLSNKASISTDYQEELPDVGSSRAPLKVWWAHFVVNF